MLMRVRAYSTIFYILDYRSVSTFHRQSRYGAKNPEIAHKEFRLKMHAIGSTSMFCGVPQDPIWGPTLFVLSF